MKAIKFNEDVINVQKSPISICRKEFFEKHDAEQVKGLPSHDEYSISFSSTSS